MPVKQLKHNPAKVQPVTPALQALLSKDAELKVGGPRTTCVAVVTCPRGGGGGGGGARSAIGTGFNLRCSPGMQA